MAQAHDVPELVQQQVPAAHTAIVDFTAISHQLALDVGDPADPAIVPFRGEYLA
ncbi:MAG TPA: hypothetical protein VIL87_09075 [Dermatophilaceae bacterium]|jgi:hypothetical protein